MSKRWESPADDPEPPECDDELCEGGDDCTRSLDNPGCRCACHEEPEEPDGYQSEADLQALTDHYYPT